MTESAFSAKRLFLISAALGAVIGASHALAESQPETKSVGAGLTWVLDQTTTLASLTIAPGASITTADGCCITMTINGVETGLRPGAYKGNIVLSVTEPNIVKFSDALVHDFRQALYLDKGGVVTAKSVVAAAGSYTLKDGVLSGVKITSVGENFNGLFVGGGSYTIKGAKVDLTGSGGNDFAGYGAAIMSSGPDTRLVLDGATVRTHGNIRTAAVADKGSQLVVKNSNLLALGGELPWDYVPNSAMGTMKNVPWMLGLVGDNRATNLLGQNTKATYINSSITAEGWGVLSIDAGQNGRLTAINSRITIAGKSGYGTYAIGDSLNSFYGSDIRVPDYGAIVVGGNVVYGASTPETVAKLNADLNLGLTATELGALPRTRTTVKSGRFGIMIWGNATVRILDDTVFDTQQAVFLIKSAAADIQVDGAGGAQLNSRNGIVLQLMETDNPGAVTVHGKRLTIGVYHEPTSAALKAEDFDVSAQHVSDVIGTFSNIALKGDFYNSVRGGIISAAPATVGLAAAPAPATTGAVTVAAPAAPPPPSGRNLVINLTQSSVIGLISASTAKHAQATITDEDYAQLGEITNTVSPAINNGVIVSLTRSTWTITKTSYLTALSLDASSVLAAPRGYTVSMTIDGLATPIRAGAFKGQIALKVYKS